MIYDILQRYEFHDFLQNLDLTIHDMTHIQCNKVWSILSSHKINLMSLHYDEHNYERQTIIYEPLS